MRSRPLWVCSVVCSVLALSAAAQQTTVLQPLQILQGALSALQGSTPINDVTLVGTARRIAGLDDETGSATFKAVVGGASRIDLSLPSGTWIEVRNNSSNGPTGSWSGPDGVAHPMSYHNLLVDVGVFPAFTISGFTSSASAVLGYVGAETRDGVLTTHVSAAQPAPAAARNNLLQHLSETDIFLDPSTLLPVVIAFTIHPDTNALLDMPAEIHFSDYHNINGAQIPFHIQKFVNNSLILDLQFQSAALNSGITAAALAQ